MGAAFLAGLSVGFFKSREELRKKITVGKIFESQINAQKRDELTRGWHKAVKACRAFSEEN